MFKTAIKMAIISSMKPQVFAHVSRSAFTHNYSSLLSSLTMSKRYNAQLPSLQFLRHGRRKQKHSFKRYIAKFEDEADEIVELYQNVQDENSNSSIDPKIAKTRTRFRARVSYCGTPFHGWQLQPGKSTVQGEIEAALTRRFKRRIPVVGAGRTDSGVHARGQAIHFDLYPNEIPFGLPQRPVVEGETAAILTDDDRAICNTFCSKLEHSMNQMMPLDIRMFELQLAPYTWAIYQSNEEADEDDEAEGQLESDNSTSNMQNYARPWHVIQQAESKWYSYRLALGPTLWNPMERFTRTHFVHRPSFAASSDEPYAITSDDIKRLQSILKLYEGTHNFAAFGGQLEQNAKKRPGDKPMSTIRTVYKVELVKEPSYGFGRHDLVEQQHGFIGVEGNYRIDFLLKGALYKMVRNMVGTAVDVWLGRMTEEQLTDLLRTDGDGERKMGRMDNPCKPAPPEGLTLECVYYDDGF